MAWINEPNTGYWCPGPKPVGPIPISLPIDNTQGFKEILPGDIIALTELIDTIGRIRQNLQILEIGSWAGSGSTQVLAQKAAQYNGELTCIDTWKGGNAELHRNIVSSLDIFGTFQHNIRKFDNINIIKSDSSIAHKILQHQHFDVIFIDADHSYDGASKDLYNYYPKLKPDGIYCGHDCQRTWESLSDEIISTLDIQGDFDSTHYCHPGVVKAVYDFTTTLNLKNKLKLWSTEHYRIGNCAIWSIILDQNIYLSPSQASFGTSQSGIAPS